jgi:hypothetical protein
MHPHDPYHNNKEVTNYKTYPKYLYNHLKSPIKNEKS